jgi:hypothetical protein
MRWLKEGRPMPDWVFPSREGCLTVFAPPGIDYPDL